MKTAIVTDSNSGITQSQGEELGIHVVPMPFYIDGEIYYEGINLTQEEFYHKLEHDAQISTSMPAPGDVRSGCLYTHVQRTFEFLPDSCDACRL